MEDIKFFEKVTHQQSSFNNIPRKQSMLVNAQRSNLAYTKPDYHMTLTTDEMQLILDLVASHEDAVISKKNTDLGDKLPRYTILKAQPNIFYLIGDGRKKNMNQNAFFGSGISGRVKGTIKVATNGSSFQAENKDYVVKILRPGENRYSQALLEARFF